MTARRPLAVVLRRPDLVEATARRLREEGWTVHTGWDLPDEPWDLRDGRRLASGVVSGRTDARRALQCLRRADGVVLALDVPAAEGASILADLHRIAEVRAEASAPPAPLPITAEQRELLELVAEGTSVPEAAAQLYLSARTAERRLAQTRKALGVRTTAEAIAVLLAARRGEEGWR